MSVVVMREAVGLADVVSREDLPDELRVLKIDSGVEYGDDDARVAFRKSPGAGSFDSREGPLPAEMSHFAIVSGAVVDAKVAQ